MMDQGIFVTKIDELRLLVTILRYARENGIPPTGEVLMELKIQFAPSLARVDTLRMWLNRHKSRTIRRVNDGRPYRYELNRQGEKRIVFLVERYLRKAISIKQLGFQGKRDLFPLYLIARDLAKTEEKKQLLTNLYLQFAAA